MTRRRRDSFMATVAEGKTQGRYSASPHETRLEVGLSADTSRSSWVQCPRFESGAVAAFGG